MTSLACISVKVVAQIREDGAFFCDGAEHVVEEVFRSFTKK